MRSLLRCSLALLLLVAVACSSDSKQSAGRASTSTTTTTIKTLAVDQIDAAASPFCAAWAEILGSGAPALTNDPAQNVGVRKAHYAKLIPLTEKLVAAADGDIKPAAEFALAQVRDVAKTGSDEAFSTESNRTMQQRLAKYALDHCTK